VKVFVCERGYEGIMSAIYDAWHEAVHIGHSNIRIERRGEFQQNLFDEYIDTKSDSVKAEKVSLAIRTKISPLAYYWTFIASLDETGDSPDIIYRFLILGFKAGGKVTDMLSEKAVMDIMELKRRIENEKHHFVEFSRFSMIHSGRENVYVAHIEPHYNVVALVARHFDDRMPSENYIIIDDIRRIAAVHGRDEPFYVKELTLREYDELSVTESFVDSYTDMWKTFFEAITIKQRKNPKCQNNLFPIWLRKHATEFN